MGFPTQTHHIEHLGLIPIPRLLLAEPIGYLCGSASVNPNGLGRHGVDLERRRLLKQHNVGLVDTVERIIALVLEEGEDKGVVVVWLAKRIRSLAEGK